MKMHSEILYRDKSGELKRLNGCTFPNMGGWSSPEEYVKEQEHSKWLYRGTSPIRYLNGLEFDNYANTRQRVWFA